MAKTRSQLPHLYYPRADSVRIINSHWPGTPTPGDEVSGWISRVVGNGGVVSEPIEVAARAFVAAAKSNGYWDKLNRVNLMAGDSLAACLIPLVIGDGYAADDPIGFASTDFTPEGTLGGLLSNGANKVLDTGLSPAALGRTSNYFTAYIRSEVINVARAYFGVGINAADAWNCGCGSTGNSGRFVRNSTSASLSITGQGPHLGLQGMSRTATQLTMITHATATAQTLAPHSTASSLPIHVFGRNDGSGAYLHGRISGYFAGDYLDAAERSALRGDYEDFQLTLGRSAFA